MAWIAAEGWLSGLKFVHDGLRLDVAVLESYGDSRLSSLNLEEEIPFSRIQWSHKC